MSAVYGTAQFQKYFLGTSGSGGSDPKTGRNIIGKLHLPVFLCQISDDSAAGRTQTCWCQFWPQTLPITAISDVDPDIAGNRMQIHCFGWVYTVFPTLLHACVHDH